MGNCVFPKYDGKKISGYIFERMADEAANTWRKFLDEKSSVRRVLEEIQKNAEGQGGCIKFEISNLRSQRNGRSYNSRLSDRKRP